MRRTSVKTLAIICGSLSFSIFCLYLFSTSDDVKPKRSGYFKNVSGGQKLNFWRTYSFFHIYQTVTWKLIFFVMSKLSFSSNYIEIYKVSMFTFLLSTSRLPAVIISCSWNVMFD